MRARASLLAFALVVCAGGTVHADERDQARAAFKTGSRHYNLGEFEQALASFREAYRFVDDPSFLFNIAQCERQLSHKKEAVREYRAYLNNAPTTIENRDEIKQIIAQLEKEIADEQNTAKMPPTGTTQPPPPVGPVTTTPNEPTATAVAPGVSLTASAPPSERKPAYKKWWVWTIVGGVVVAGAAAGLAVGLTHQSAPTASTSLGTRSPF
ncbi:MAG TPA: tetratricopeptide repeat protein [Polyangia bacterium]|nr:tetratricopeptide repeat protein [Polyangia bacterium]